MLKASKICEPRPCMVEVSLVRMTGWGAAIECCPRTVCASRVKDPRTSGELHVCKLSVGCCLDECILPLETLNLLLVVRKQIDPFGAHKLFLCLLLNRGIRRLRLNWVFHIAMWIVISLV